MKLNKLFESDNDTISLIQKYLVFEDPFSHRYFAATDIPSSITYEQFNNTLMELSFTSNEIDTLIDANNYPNFIEIDRTSIDTIKQSIEKQDIDYILPIEWKKWVCIVQSDLHEWVDDNDFED